MEPTLTILMILTMIATAVTLGFGIFSFLKQKKGTAAYSNKMMRYRVFFQALTLIFVTVLLYMSRG